MLLGFTLLAGAVNALALQRPGATPFLVGNMAAVAITLRFGLAWAMPVALLASVITANPYWFGLAVLECIRVSRATGTERPLLAAWWSTWWPLLPLVAWATLPAGADDPLLWIAGIGVVLLNGAVALMGGRQLVRVTRSSRQMADQPMATQLTVQLATLMAVPVVLALALLLQWTHQQDLRCVARPLDAAPARLEGAIGAELLELDPRAPLPARVAVDALRLKQIVLNLVGNAMKFTASGGVRVVVEWEPAAGRWRVVVADTGIGMDDAPRERLFQRFEQTGVSTTRRSGGTGLGLHISRELARRMGGDIDVESTPGAGGRSAPSARAGRSHPRRRRRARPAEPRARDGRG
ncbi:MAG: ATP-binding protein, partial [Lysobacteraceae bacterium]